MQTRRQGKFCGSKFLSWAKKMRIFLENWAIKFKKIAQIIRVFLKMQFLMIKSTIFFEIFAFASFGHMYFFTQY